MSKKWKEVIPPFIGLLLALLIFLDHYYAIGKIDHLNENVVNLILVALTPIILWIVGKWTKD